MDVETAIRTRRTHKAYEPDPVPREVVEELLELARWAPNHHLTQPWRFRVIGPETFKRLAAAGREGEEQKLGRAPTLIVATAKLTGDAHQDAEDVQAACCAVYAVLLGAHARGLASYWRTPKVLQMPEGRAAVGIEDDEQFVGLIHLGRPVSDPAPKPREPAEAYVDFLA